MYICIPRNAIVKIPQPQSGDSHYQETFLAPSAEEQTVTMTQSAQTTPLSLPIAIRHWD